MPALLRILALCTLLATTAATAQPLTRERALAAASEPHNWLLHGRTYDEQRFSSLTQIDRNSVAQLGLAWYLDFDTLREGEATPIVVDGVMYVTSAWSIVYAIDARSGALLWKHDPQVPRITVGKTCCGPVNRGVAVWEDKVIFGALDGRLIALDRATGEVLWSVVTVDQTRDYTITGAPRIVNGKVIIGNGGGEFGVRGYVSAYDVNSGEQLWRFYTVPGNPADGFENPQMAMAAKTWTGEWWHYGGGGTVWDSMAYDPELNLLYIGVGNGSPWNRRIRSPGGGDNLFLSSIVALNPDTGEYRWHYQETPAETWDYTATQHIVIADIEWQGKPRKVLLHAPKNGFFFVIDRVTGEFLSAEPYVPVNWASHYEKIKDGDKTTGRPVENWLAGYGKVGWLIKPSSLGAHNWQPMAYHPELKRVFIPTLQLTQYYQDERWNREFRFTVGKWNTGTDFSDPLPTDHPQFYQRMLKENARGALLAWDPLAQKPVWEVRHALPGNGGVLATAANLVFQGTADGYLRAFTAEDGTEVWKYPTQLGIMAPPISYAIDGAQYIAVLTGRGGPTGMTLGLQFADGLPTATRVLVFRLGGNAQLPPLPAPPEPTTLPARPDVSWFELRRGRALYFNHCGHCHGMTATGNGIVPDLRRMPAAWHTMFRQVVLDGAMESAGMKSFRDVLTEDDVSAIQNYVLEQAWTDLDHRQALLSPTWWDRIVLWCYDTLGWLTGLLLRWI